MKYPKLVALLEQLPSEMLEQIELVAGELTPGEVQDLIDPTLPRRMHDWNHFWEATERVNYPALSNLRSLVMAAQDFYDAKYFKRSKV